MSKMRTRSYIYYDNERNSAVGDRARMLDCVFCILYRILYTIIHPSRHWPEIRKNFHQLTQKLFRVHYIMCVLDHGIGSGPLQLNDWWRVAILSNPPCVVLFVRMECASAHSCVLPRWNRLRFLCECCGNRLEN